MNSARIRTIASWLPTLDEARLREVEDFVLAKAIDQQDSASARADVSHGNPQAGGGTFSRVEVGLRELATATPQVAAPGVADDHTLWSAEMVDGRFDGSDE